MKQQISGMRSVLILLILLLMGVESNAQTLPASITKVPVEGTPYLDDSYVKGTVFMVDHNYNTDLRYNIFSDQVEFKGISGVESLTPAMPVRKIVMGKNTFVIDTYLQKGKLAHGFFIMLDSGGISIMRKLNVIITPYVAAAPFQDPKPAAYERKADNYYIKIGIQNLAEIHNVKKMIQSLPDHQKEMEEFAKKNKTSADDPAELKEFSRYYNSLK